MKSIIVGAALALISAIPLLSATSHAQPRYVRWTCKAFFGNQGYAYYYTGYSGWYPPSTWYDPRYKEQARKNALNKCGQQSGGIRCYLLDCDKQSWPE